MMIKKLLVIGLLFLGKLGYFNGCYQTTTIEFEGIQETCYGTLLSKTSETGSWSYSKPIELDAPDNVMQFFREYEDDDHFFYLNYFEDVSGGLLYWPYYPPEEFKVLLYFPETDSFLTTEASVSRYALTSKFKAVFENGTIRLTRNYNYLRLFINACIRFITGVLSAMLICMIMGKPLKKEIKYYLVSNIIFHLLLNIFISVFSYYNGFTMVEYFMFLWVPYLLLLVLQGYLYSRKTITGSPWFCAFFSNLAAYGTGMLMVDFLPGLYTIL